ncbi:hypothetical protein ACQP2P_34030 [Dactylosporangium sp. CA-139114]|uniref:hypothetical protein n=1 Tax=Dactylosporangium sp. CA-139114 TaxID=3239931 RepID=UPI003D98480D
MRLAEIVKWTWRSAGTRWTLLVVLVMVLALPLWGLRPYGKHFDHDSAGTWGDWVTGIGQLAAVITAVVTVLRTERLSRMQVKTAVGAWMAVFQDNAQPYWAVQFENATRLPLFQWTADSADGAVHLCHLHHGLLIPGKTTYELTIDRPCDQSLASPLVLRFVDFDGRTWERDSLGRLAPVKTPVACRMPSTSVKESSDVE